MLEKFWISRGEGGRELGKETWRRKQHPTWKENMTQQMTPSAKNLKNLKTI